MGSTQFYRITGVLAVLIFAWSAPALANMKQIKNYKEAFPDAKPKCAVCHSESLPKKGEGQHAFNAYGQKVVAMNQVPTAEDYTKAGKA